MARWRSPALLLILLLLSALPALFLLNAVVQRNRVKPTPQLRVLVRQDGATPLVFAAPFRESEGRWLAVGPLRAGSYPWKATTLEAAFALDLQAQTASLSLRQTTRGDGLGSPPIECRGALPPELREAPLDLICTEPGPDLAWGSADDVGWSLEGSITP